MGLFIVYELDLNTNFTLKDSLFGAVKLTKMVIQIKTNIAAMA